MSGPGEAFPGVVELNVGGTSYSTSLETLRRHPDSVLGRMFAAGPRSEPPRDGKGRYFVDRDGQLFRYVLDYLRTDRLLLPAGFPEKERLRREAEHFQLKDMVAALSQNATVPQCPQCGRATLAPLQHKPAGETGDSAPPSPAKQDGKKPGFITIGYCGTFAFGPNGVTDVKFRKLARIFVCGKVNMAREVFGDTLNESRDPDRGMPDRYTSRFYLKHTYLEQAFDMLAEAGFALASAAANGTGYSNVQTGPGSTGGVHEAERAWSHYNEFVFQRE
ncbi:BTB/POZ domain-containing protein KCTD8-like [Branchiostoma floridae]|uniref:BTB/POZ domain-containing protein KCTD8-like n=1 Tax=Branchiostoma floridae TaxID=7739 RepID=A0A9J7LGD7_BRAFL|nr:BTB/POZ domain-containing protein KCTD8-like [Branchiostoma floridae]